MGPPMSPSSRYVTVVALVGAAYRRQYELPGEPSEADREAFQRWLLDVIPTIDERSRGQRVEFWREETASVR